MSISMTRGRAVTTGVLAAACALTIAGGVVAPVANNVALTPNLARTLGQQGGDDFYGTGGVRVSF